MENNSYYLNLLFFLFLSFSFFTLIKYFFYERCSLSLAIERSTYTFSKLNRKDHIYFIPNAYNFLERGKVNNVQNIYIFYIKKIFEVIEFLLKNNIHTVTIDLFNLNLLNLIGVDEIESLFKNKKFWTFFKNFIYHQGIKVNFKINSSLFQDETIYLLKNLEKKVSEVHSNFTVNFLIGNDIFEEITKTFSSIHQKVISEKKNINEMKREEIKKYFMKDLTQIDLIIGCENTSLTDSLLIEAAFAKVFYLNLSLENISKEIIDTIIFEQLRKNTS